MRVILIGGGDVIYFLAREYLSKGYQVSIVNVQADECDRLAKVLDEALIINGNGTDPLILEEAQAREAQLLLAVTPHDYINLVCCQTGSLMFGIPRTLAMINDPDNYEVYKKFGISQVFSQTELMVAMLERNISYDYLTNLVSWEDKAFIDEIRINEKMPSVGAVVKDIKLPENSHIVGIERDENFDLHAEDRKIQVGDRVILLTTPENHAPALRMIAGSEV